MNVEQEIVTLLNNDPVFTGLGLEAFMDVPSPRPIKFVTVERTGGFQDKWIDNPQLVFQVWADTRFNASTLAEKVKPVIQGLAYSEHIHRVDITSTFNFPDPESGQARYQLVVVAVTK